MVKAPRIRKRRRSKRRESLIGEGSELREIIASPEGEWLVHYTWPNGKERWRTDAGLTSRRDQASRYTRQDAIELVVERSTDAQLIWGIKARRVKA